MDLKIKNKTAVVTGGGNGIGAAIALRLAAEGAKVVVADLSAEAADKVADAIKSRKGDTLAVAGDATKPEEVESMVQRTLDCFGAIDILVNNVGGGSGTALVIDTKTKDWDQTIEVNLKAPFLCCRLIAREMIPRKSGRIISISSVSGKTGEALIAPYCAAKFGVIGFTQVLARELARHNITVNAVCPGYVFTSGWERLARSLKENYSSMADKSLEEIFMARVKAVTPLGRPQSADEIAGMVAYLASEEARSITGQAISVDGGAFMG